MLVRKRHKVLRQMARHVTTFDEDLRKLLDKMFSQMTSHRGIGIAAPQIGVGLQAALVVDVAGQQVFEIINPRIVERFGGAWKHVEGCLSLPGQQHTVTRHGGIVLEYQDSLGQQHRKTFQGTVAQIIQHEVDHLDGILIDDHEKVQ